jgi:hypothetical protein
MSHYRLKTTYEVEGAYGSREKKILYAHINNVCDITSFYDEDGTYMFSVEDTEKNNLFHAIERLLYAWNEDGRELREGVQHLKPEEFKFIGQ